LTKAIWLLVAVMSSTLHAAQGEWRHHGHDHASTKYSPLTQIDAANFEKLEVAWRWVSADHRLSGPDLYYTGDYRATPLKVGDRVYTATSHGQVVALNAATGAEIWLYDPESYKAGMPNMQPLQTRGIEYWRDGDKERIFIATLGKQLISIDVNTGKPDPQFGEEGIVDLKQDLGVGEYEINNITHGAPPIAVGDSVIVGSKIFDYVSKIESPPGHVRAYDAHTGEFKWRFNTIPKEGEPFTETWEDDAWRTAGNTNVWTFMAADHDLGLVYLPTSTPTNDYFGGKRKGDNLFAESIVAVKADTGERVWHFQTVHHGLWDYDIASAPNLVDIVVDGKPIKAIAQVSKTAFAYVLDRATGEPVWPIEEKPVPQSTVPGERSAATQPHPTKPPPFDRVGVTEDDLIDFTPELKAEALELASKLVLGPIFTPPIVFGEGGKEGTFVVPGAGGGASFPGASFDPETNILYVESQTRPTGMGLASPDQNDADFSYVIKYVGTAGPQGLPLLKPPYRRITAIDLNKGEFAWQIPFGDGPTNHPALKDLDLGPLGSGFSDVVAEGGIVVTKTLLITYISKRDQLGDRQATGSFLWALDKESGEIVGEVAVDARLHGAPTTYMQDGRQYIAVAAGGRRETQQLITFALPR
jgi:quinoprotein glucose dehydrogenase